MVENKSCSTNINEQLCQRPKIPTGLVSQITGRTNLAQKYMFSLILLDSHLQEKLHHDYCIAVMNTTKLILLDSLLQEK